MMVTTDTTTKTGWRKYVKIHPAADALPLLPPDQLRELADDIDRHGLKNQIRMLGQGVNGITLSPKTAVLIDGRNRLDAWELLGRPLIAPETGEWDREFFQWHVTGGTLIGSPGDDDAVTEVISQNIRRRHLSERERIDLALAVVQTTKASLTAQVSAVKARRPVGGGKGKLRGSTKSVVGTVAAIAGVHRNTARKRLAERGAIVAPRAPALEKPQHTNGARSAAVAVTSVKKTATTWDGQAAKIRLRDVLAVERKSWPEGKRALFGVTLREIAKEFDVDPESGKKGGR